MDNMRHILPLMGWAGGLGETEMRGSLTGAGACPAAAAVAASNKLFL